jgi:hypothetical protein
MRMKMKNSLGLYLSTGNTVVLSSKIVKPKQDPRVIRAAEEQRLAAEAQQRKAQAEFERNVQSWIRGTGGHMTRQLAEYYARNHGFYQGGTANMWPNGTNLYMESWHAKQMAQLDPNWPHQAALESKYGIPIYSPLDCHRIANKTLTSKCIRDYWEAKRKDDVE